VLDVSLPHAGSSEGEYGRRGEERVGVTGGRVAAQRNVTAGEPRDESQPKVCREFKEKHW
jgi:hypothetical protein